MPERHSIAPRTRAGGEGKLNPPPLAKDLVGREFDEIAREIPSARPVIDRLRERMGTEEPEPLEAALAALAGESRNAMERRQQLMAFRFFLHRIIEDTVSKWLERTGGFTHYLRLLNALYDWQQTTATPIRLVTFNYDVMLEQALTDVIRWPFDALPRYVERDDWRVYKLHGSTTWSRLLPTSANIGLLSIDAAMDLARGDATTGGEIMAVRPQLQVEASRTSGSLDGTAKWRSRHSQCPWRTKRTSSVRPSTSARSLKTCRRSRTFCSLDGALRSLTLSSF